MVRTPDGRHDPEIRTLLPRLYPMPPGNLHKFRKYFGFMGKSTAAEYWAIGNRRRPRETGSDRWAAVRSEVLSSSARSERARKPSAGRHAHRGGSGSPARRHGRARPEADDGDAARSSRLRCSRPAAGLAVRDLIGVASGSGRFRPWDRFPTCLSGEPKRGCLSRNRCVPVSGPSGPPGILPGGPPQY